MTPIAFAHTFSNFLAYLAEPALRSLMVGGAAAIALAALRVKRVAVRLRVWTAVLCVALAMPLLGMVLPRTPLAIPASSMELISQRVQVFRMSAQRTVVSGQQKAATSEEQGTKSWSHPSQEQRRKGHPASPSSLEVNDASLYVAQVFRSEGSSLRHSAGAMSAKNGVLACASVFRDCHSEEAALAPTKNLASNALIKGHGEIPRSAEIRFAQNDGDVRRLAAVPVMPLKMIPVIADGSGMPPIQVAGEIALGIYLFVAAILLARLLTGMWFSRRLARAAREICPQYFTGGDDAGNRQEREALRLLRFRSCTSRLANAPELKESDAVSVPATVGVHYAAILLPSEWRKWPEEQLDAILAHEVSHVARRDALTQALSLVHRAIFWFSPLAWWLDKQLTELAEQASDEAALAGGADRMRYAETLLGFFAQLEAARGRIWWQGVSMAKKSRGGSAERRVDRILAWKGAMSMKKSLAVALVAVAAPVVFFAASLHPVIAQTRDKTQRDAKNVILPGGPKAPVLPNAPKGGIKGGVAAPALAPAPAGGVVAPAIAAGPSAPAPREGVANPGPMPPAPQGGVVAPLMPAAPTGPRAVRPEYAAPFAPTTPSARPALMPVPDAPEHPPIVPGPIAGDPFAPRSAAPAIASTAPYADLAPMSPVAAIVSVAPQDSSSQSTRVIVGDTANDRAYEEQLRAAQKALRDAEQQLEANTEQLRAAQKALRDAQKQSAQADSEQLRMAEDKLARAENARAESEAARAKFKAQLEQERADLDAARAQNDQQGITVEAGSNLTIHGRYSSWSGSRYVIMSGADEGVEMSGDDEDFHHAQELRKKLGKDLIWFERDEKSYVITDPAFIAKAKALFAPEEELSKQQDALGKQQDELGRQQDALGEQMDAVKVKAPDITPDLERILARLKELQASGATQRELGDAQRELGDLQRRIGEVQRDAGVQQGAIGRQQGELGRKQGELGRKQGELGRRQGEIAREASRQLRTMFDDAIAKGIAKPE